MVLDETAKMKRLMYFYVCVFVVCIDIKGVCSVKGC